MDVFFRLSNVAVSYQPGCSKIKKTNVIQLSVLTDVSAGTHWTDYET